MLRISHLSKILGIPEWTLRKMEKQGLLKSTRTEGGHRRYSIEECERLKRELKKLRKWGLEYVPETK